MKDHVDLLAIKVLRSQLEAFRTKPRPKPRLAKDGYGECATIRYAQVHVTAAVVISINDTLGRQLAAAHKLPTVTTGAASVHDDLR